MRSQFSATKLRVVLRTKNASQGGQRAGIWVMTPRERRESGNMHGCTTRHVEQAKVHLGRADRGGRWTALRERRTRRVSDGQADVHAPRPGHGGLAGAGVLGAGCFLWTVLRGRGPGVDEASWAALNPWRRPRSSAKLRPWKFTLRQKWKLN
jgi:hypothetical protein